MKWLCRLMAVALAALLLAGWYYLIRGAIQWLTT